MEANNAETHTWKYRFSFSRAIWAGFVTTLLIAILNFLQGHDNALIIGKMMLGSEAKPVYVHMAGGAFCFLVGIVFALFYALIIAPMRFMSDFVQGILFAVIMTIIAFFTFPKLQTIFDAVLKREPGSSAVQTQAQGTELAKVDEEIKTEKPEEKSSETNKNDMKKELLDNFINHLIYALSVIVIYRQCRKSK